MRVQSLDDVPDQLPGVKGDGVEGLGADPRPKGAERLGLQLLRVRPGGDVAAVGVLRGDGPGGIDAGEDLRHGGAEVLKASAQPDGTSVPVRKEAAGEDAVLHIALFPEGGADLLRQLPRHPDPCPGGASEEPAGKQARLHRPGAAGKGRRQPLLQGLRESAELHIGDERQLVQLLHRPAQDAFVHAFALLIDTQAQPAADLLAAADLRLRLGLQHTDLEHIGVVPPLPEGGVREEEPHRFIQAEQPLLVPHDQVIGVRVEGGSALAVDLSLHKAGLAALPPVYGEVALVGLAGIDAVQIGPVRRVVDLSPERLRHGDVLLLKHFGVLAAAAAAAVPVVQAVFGHLVDEEEGQHFHSPGIQLPFPAEVGADGLPNLHPALESCPLLAAAELTGI